MNLDQFAAGFQNLPESEGKAENQEGDIVLAGTIHSITKEICRIEINGTQYEVSSDEVIDIQDVSQAGGSSDVGKKEKEEKKGDAGEGEAGSEQGPRLVLITVKKNTILRSQFPVQADILAAMGTWLWVVVPSKDDCEGEEGEAA